MLENVKIGLFSVSIPSEVGGKVDRSVLPQKLFSRQNTSDDSVNVTISNSPSIKKEPAIETCSGEADERLSQSQSQSQTVKPNRSSKTFFKKKDKVPKNNEAHGFISSFNQLTSNNLPVITSATTTMIKHASNKCERDNHAIVDDTVGHSVFENALGQSKANAKDDRSKYSKWSLWFLLNVNFEKRKKK